MGHLMAPGGRSSTGGEHARSRGRLGHAPRCAADAAPVTFTLRDATGAILLEHTEGKFDWDDAKDVKTGPQPLWQAPAPDARSLDDWMRVAHDQELVGNITDLTKATGFTGDRALLLLDS